MTHHPNPRDGSPLRVKLTLRDVPFLDDLVYLICNRVEGLGQETGVRGSCEVETRAHWWRGQRVYAVDIEVSRGNRPVRVSELDRDLVCAIDAAFLALRDQIRMAPAGWPTAEPEIAGNHDGWQPVRRRPGRLLQQP